MLSLEQQFDQVANSEATASQLENLGIIVMAHSISPYAPTTVTEAAAAKNLVLSSTPDASRSILIDRTAEMIVEHYDTLTPGALQAFALGGRVADIGSGTSGFLTTFSGGSDTIAVDTHPAHLEIQAARDHQTLLAPAHDLSGIEDGSIRLLNARNSVPIWASSPTESAGGFGEYVRVLEPGGVALIDPTVRDDIRGEWEVLIERTKISENLADVRRVFGNEEDILSHVFAAFAKGIVEAHRAERIRVALFRSAQLNSGTYAPTPPEYQVPESIMLQKVKG